MNLGIKRCDYCKHLPLPEFKTKEAACFDLYVSKDTTLQPFTGTLVPAGVVFDTPEGYFVEIHLRSSMCKLGIVSSAGIIDSDFRGEVHVQAVNITPGPILLKEGDRIGQARLVKLVPTELFETETVRETERGTNGWGSTGR